MLVRDDEVGGGSKYDKSNESGESEEETRSSGKSRVRFKPKYNRRKKRQHGWQGVSIPLFDYLGSKFKDLTTLKRLVTIQLYTLLVNLSLKKY